jgi:uncharacterized membrane protein YeaQ/YmgE (transglycosylase-associated protein family)
VDVGIIGFILIGLVVGVIARLLLPGKDPIGIIATIVVGIVGALIGGYLFGSVFNNNTQGVDWLDFVGAILVSMLLLFLYRKMTYGRDTHRSTV